MKNIKNLGTVLSKVEQKKIAGGCPHPNPCDSYSGPVAVTCAQYDRLAPEHKFCVLVSVDCFPF